MVYMHKALDLLDNLAAIYLNRLLTVELLIMVMHTLPLVNLLGIFRYSTRIPYPAYRNYHTVRMWTSAKRFDHIISIFSLFIIDFTINRQYLLSRSPRRLKRNIVKKKK